MADGPDPRPASRADPILVAAFLVACMFAAASTICDPDMFHTLSLGREIAARGYVPLDDAFAFTPTRIPVVHHEWLTGLVLYHVVATTGAPGLLALKWVSHFATFACVLAVARARGASPVTMAFLAPWGIGLAALGMTTLRAGVFTLCGVAMTLGCLELDRRGGRRWMVPYAIAYVVWLNCHGGFVVGPALVALHAVEQGLARRPVRHLVPFLVVLALLVLVNPYGVAYPQYLWEAIRMDRSNIGEWRPLGDEHPWAVPFWGLSLLVFVYAWLPDGAFAHPGWLAVLTTAIAAYLHQRHVSLYGLVWLAAVPPMVEPRRMARAFRNVWGARPWVTRALLTAGIAAALLHAASNRRWTITVPTRPDPESHVAYPVGAVEYLRAAHVTGNMVTPFELGAFVSWHCAPDVRVSLDGRYEAAYAEPRALADAHVEFYEAGPGWRAFLDRHPVDLVLAKRTAPVVGPMSERPEWRTAYEDDTFLVFARSDRTWPRVDRRGEHIPGRFP